MTSPRMVLAAVSGSFHRHMREVAGAVEALTALGVHVVSPADPRIVASVGEFIFVASDRIRSIRLVQDRHLESIAAADFVWLVSPDGYVGQSASMEIGFAAARHVPIFGTTLPSDLTLRQYVTSVPTIAEAVKRAALSPARETKFLIDPHASIDHAHVVLDRLRAVFNTADKVMETDLAARVTQDRKQLMALFSPVGNP